MQANAVGFAYGEAEELRTLAEATSRGSSLELGSIDFEMSDDGSMSEDHRVNSDKENIPPPRMETAAHKSRGPAGLPAVW